MVFQTLEYVCKGEFGSYTIRSNWKEEDTTETEVGSYQARSMGGSTVQELLKLSRGIIPRLMLRISHLIPYYTRDRLDASRHVAILGFVIALICFWKYLKGPQQHSNRRSTRRHFPSSSSTVETNPGAISRAVAKPITKQNEGGAVIGDSGLASELMLEQTVRRNLQGGKKMTVNLVGVVLEEDTPEQVQKHAVVRSTVVDVLLEISRSCDLYLLGRVLDDESEALVLAALEATGVFTLGGLNRNKILFCSTEGARASFVRQLEPDWHVDTSVEITAQLARFIRHQLLISPSGAAPVGPNVFGVESLEQYFGFP